jgi:hypothetical protein
MLGVMEDGKGDQGHDRTQEMCGAFQHSPSYLLADREDTTMTTANRLLMPEPPFLWPEPRVLDGSRSYASDLPFEHLVQREGSILGIVVALGGQGIDHLRTWLENNSGLQVTLIVAVYPTCSTKQNDIIRLRELADHYRTTLQIRLRPYAWVTDRPTNVLCFIDQASDSVDMIIGASENLGFDPRPDGKINVVFRADPALVDAYQQYFTWVWGQARDILKERLPPIPELVLPEGSAEAARRWEAFCHACLDDAQDSAAPRESVHVDPETGTVALKSRAGKDLVPPSVAAGFPESDPLTTFVARLYSKGKLVTIDKLSRIPPLDAPLDPAWFGDVAERQHGNVTRRISMRVSIIDEHTLKEIEKRKNALRSLLNKFTFGLADNARWMPNPARPLFDAEMERVNQEGQKLVSELLQGNVAAFIAQKKDALVADLNAMYQAIGQHGQVTAGVIARVSKNLEERLTRAQTANFMPALSYTGITFSHTSNTWANPWGQAYALLADIAVFPRKALTDSFFFRGLRVSEDALLEAMNVADDALLRDARFPRLKDRGKLELALLTRIEQSSLAPKAKCEFVWKVITGCDAQVVASTLEAQEKTMT